MAYLAGTTLFYRLSDLEVLNANTTLDLVGQTVAYKLTAAEVAAANAIVGIAGVSAALVYPLMVTSANHGAKTVDGIAFLGSGSGQYYADKLRDPLRAAAAGTWEFWDGRREEATNDRVYPMIVVEGNDATGEVVYGSVLIEAGRTIAVRNRFRGYDRTLGIASKGNWQYLNV